MTSGRTLRFRRTGGAGALKLLELPVSAHDHSQLLLNGVELRGSEEARPASTSRDASDWRAGRNDESA